MRLMGSVLALTVAASVASATPPAPDRKPLSFGAEAEMVNVVIAVTTKKGQPVADLSPENFTILEDYIPQEIALFERSAPNMDVVFMIDASGSMANKPTTDGKPLIVTAKVAAKKFLRFLRPGDRAMVIEFAAAAKRHVNPGDPFTADTALLEAAIDDIIVRTHTETVRNPQTGQEFEQTTGEPTMLYTSLYVVLKEIVDKRPQLDPEHPRRAVVVMLTDGEDTASVVSADQVTEQARVSGAPIYSIMIPGSKGAIGSDSEQHAHDAEFFLRTLAQESGGSLEKLEFVNQLNAAFARIARGLQTQYRVGYRVTNTKPTLTGWHSIQVSVKGRPDLTVRHRLGYYAKNSPKTP